jgi:hypothetical protein
MPSHCANFVEASLEPESCRADATANTAYCPRWMLMSRLWSLEVGLIIRPFGGRVTSRPALYRRTTLGATASVYPFPHLPAATYDRCEMRKPTSALLCLATIDWSFGAPARRPLSTRARPSVCSAPSSSRPAGRLFLTTTPAYLAILHFPSLSSTPFHEICFRFI